MTYQPALTPPKRKKVWPWILGAGIVAFLALLATCAGILTNASNPVSVNTTPDPPQATAAVGQKASKTDIGAGDWLVGKDVAAGTYRTSGADDSAVPLCHWVVWTNDSKTDSTTSGLSDKANQPGRAVLKKGNVFETSGCRPWVKQ
jgi:hypothetical protein